MSSTSTGALPASTLPVVPDPTAPIRLLTFTTLYPHAGLPNQGVFVENRLRHLVATGLATSTVLAPVPWFPSRHPRFGGWARFARAAHEETRHGLRVLHPRYAVIRRSAWPLPRRRSMPRPRVLSCALCVRAKPSI